MSIKLVASDLDGTIIDRNNFIANENFKAIDRLHSKNIDFVVCTGKSYSVSKSICQNFQAKYGIFGNGAQIIDLQTGEELNRKTLKQKQINYCIKLARKNNLHIHFYTEDSIVTENLQYMDLRNYILKDLNSTELKFIIVPDIEKYIEEKKEIIIYGTGSTYNYENVNETPFYSISSKIVTYDGIVNSLNLEHL